MSDSKRAMAAAMAIGVIAGLRSMTAPAVVSWAAEQKWVRVRNRRLAFFKQKRSSLFVTALAAGEMVMDKLPIAPNRTEPLSLAWRVLTGGLSGGVLCASKRNIAKGAILGAVGAVAGTFAGFHARRAVRDKLHVTDRIVAAAEDAVAVGAGILVARSV